MSIVAEPPGHRFLLENVSWKTYRALLADLGDHRGGRLTYDRGLLEIMSPSTEHERWKKLLGRLIEAFADELNIDSEGFGSATLNHDILEQGVEPDDCFYIANEAVIRDKKRIDLTVDPPPDLAIEVEITRSSLSRLRIYAGLRVPEVWRYDGKVLRILRLQDDGQYLEVEKSSALAALPVPDLVRFLNQRGSKSQTQIVRAFRAWIRVEFQLKNDSP